ncbi:hypothetical protein [Thermobifida halotolerans]|nr:hypothetical protein [Thermobifida halotolerans]
MNSAGSNRSSPTTASASNSTPNTVAATSRIASPAVLEASSPRVALVATGQMPPRGRPGSLWPVTEARRRSSIATSVPCAPP